MGAFQDVSCQDSVCAHALASSLEAGTAESLRRNGSSGRRANLDHGRPVLAWGSLPMNGKKPGRQEREQVGAVFAGVGGVEAASPGGCKACCKLRVFGVQSPF